MLPQFSDPSAPRLTINLSAIEHNWRFYHSRHPSTEVACVVKADAYGLGAEHVAKHMIHAGCRSFFVATLHEGIFLRAFAPNQNIYVFNGLVAGQEEAFIQYGLIPCLNDLGQISLWRQQAAKLGRPVPSAIQFDSGMSRLGLMPEDAKSVSEDWHLLEGLDLRLFMTHMACADDPKHPLNAEQFSTFKKILKNLPEVRASFAASYGGLSDVAYGLDLLRPGIGIYGGISHPDFQHVITLEATVLQTRDIPKNSGVGYSAAFVAQRNTRIATLNVGYADGYIRAGGEQGFVIIDTHRAPIVGRISMDLITVDITDIPEQSVHVGQAVTLIGPERSVSEVAKNAGTIPYEILTALGKRYRRTYVTETEPSSKSQLS